jgi:serine protease
VIHRIVSKVGLAAGIPLLLAACSSPGGSSSIIRDDVSPTVTLSSPAADVLVEGTASLSATAGDNTGIAGVQFRAGSSDVGGEDTTAPYQTDLDTTAFSDGYLQLSAVARDSAGNETTSEAVKVVVANSTGVVSGRIDAQIPVQLSSFGSNEALAESLGIPAEAEFVEGEALVKFRPGSDGREIARSLQAAVVREVSGRAQLLRAGGSGPSSRKPATVAEGRSTLELVAALRARRDVVYAEPNYIRRPAKVPTDVRYADQWHYPAANLPAAWHITTGAGTVVVAILDTGILYHATDAALRHPDFDPGRILPGYDFYDGDANPYDEGPVDATGYHGTHVAGTIGAWTSDNTQLSNPNGDVGVAGVDWSAGLVNVRVLGPMGGSDADVADGIRWAAGLSVPFVSDNANPAAVINMSLGGPGLSQAIQDAVDDATAPGAIVVVAAGNEGDDARAYSPAGQNNVITVGATGPSGDLTYYSNFGPAIEIMAPGGEQGPSEDGVLSTAPYVDGDGVAHDYAYYQGTSMASPHIAGIVALMKSVNPGLDTVSATNYLRDSAIAISTADCNAYGCGPGLVDGEAAVLAAQAAGAVGPYLGTTMTVANLGTGSSGSFVIDNLGDGTLNWSAASASTRISFDAASGSTAAGQTDTASFTIDREGLGDGTYFATIEIEDDGHNRGTVILGLQEGSGSSDVGPLNVYLWDPVTYETLYQFATDHDDQYQFRLVAIAAGTYGLDAGDCDVNVCDPTYYGMYLGEVVVSAGDETSDVVTSVDPTRLSATGVAPSRRAP